MRRSSCLLLLLVVVPIVSVDGPSPRHDDVATQSRDGYGYSLPKGFVSLGGEGHSRFGASSGFGRVFLEPHRVRFAGPSGIVDLRFVGASAVEPRGRGQLPGRVNRVVGERSTWILGARRYSRVVYRNLYNGIDAIFHTRGNAIEYDFAVAPDANPKLIRLRFSRPFELKPSGDLVFGPFLLQERPRSYQMQARRDDIPTQFIRLRNGDVGFQVGHYDRERPLVIDPVISYSTYLGGSHSDRAHGIAVDKAGNAYVTGITYSTDFPTTNGAAQRVLGEDTDAFVASFAPDGRLRYATYLGGTPTPPYGWEGGVEDAFDVDVDNAGRAWITGATTSVDFPTKNAFQPLRPGGNTAATFVAAINPDGSLHYSTYLGGDATGEGIAVHPDQSVVITGTGRGIPTINAFQPVVAGMGNGTSDAFVTKFSPTGDHLEWSTFIGGDSWEDGEDVAIDDAGNVFVVGTTDSANFPVTPGAFQQQYHEGTDAFVAKFSSAGSLVYATYLGGEAADVASAVDVDPQGRAVVGGGTHALDSGGHYGFGEFPLKGPFDDYNDGLNGFITRMSHDGSSLVWSTYFGTTKLEIFGLAADDLGGIHVTGITWTGNLPLKMPFHERPTDIYDAFVASFSPEGKYVFGTFLGGTPPVTGQVDEERANGIAVHGKDLFVTGETMALDFPVVRAIQPHLAGVNDAFVSRLVPKRPVARHRMRMRMEMRGHIRFKVRLFAVDGFTACQRRRRIVMQGSSANGPWVRLGAPLTDANGRYRGKYVDVFGRYRWIVDSALVKVKGMWHACLPSVSNARRHAH